MAMSSYHTGASGSLRGPDLARRVCIVTDSASDILPSHAQALGIVVVPNRIVLDGRVYRDGIDITASQFYARLPRAQGDLYTEPASTDDLRYAYRMAFHQGASAILSIHISSRLSQVVSHARAMRDYLAPAPIYVLDSQQAGIGMWPAVIRGAQLAAAGTSPRDIYQHIASILSRTRLFFMVESLEYLRRGGRIGRAQELIGTLLDAHPILTIDHGEVAPLETVRQRNRALRRIRELALDHAGIETLLICGTSIESISQMELLLREGFQGAIQKTWLGPTLGANTGPGVAVAVVAR
jgi:DegV family protein with EDD domain